MKSVIKPLGFIYITSLDVVVLISIFMVIFSEDKRSLYNLIAGPLEIEEYYAGENLDYHTINM
jgi:uncharacterized RDD family membrane protein YckC